MRHSWARKTILILSESIKVVYTAVKHPCSSLLSGHSVWSRHHFGKGGNVLLDINRIMKHIFLISLLLMCFITSTFAQGEAAWKPRWMVSDDEEPVAGQTVRAGQDKKKACRIPLGNCCLLVGQFLSHRVAFCPLGNE